MANTKSAKKMTRKIAKRTVINRSRRSRMRTFLRKAEEAVATGTQSDATPAPRAPPRDHPPPSFPHADLPPQGRGGDRHRQPERRHRGAPRGRARDHARGPEGHRSQEHRLAEGLAPREPHQDAERLKSPRFSLLCQSPALV